jgi:hypothetical protein
MKPSLPLFFLAASPLFVLAQVGHDPHCVGGDPFASRYDPQIAHDPLPCPVNTLAPNIAWSGYGHDAQHTAVSAAAAQALNSIHWQTPVDQNQTGTGSLYVHYGSPIATPGNTIVVPVRTTSGGFQLNAFNGATGAQLYTLPTDYTLPAHDWTPPYAPALSLGRRIYYAGAGGTVYYRDLPNSANGPNGQAGQTGQVAFYGMANYINNPSAFNNTVQISTPLTADRSGNVFFGFTVSGPNPAGLTSGIARITSGGTGTWVSAVSLTGDSTASQIQLNCAPTLSDDQRTVYIATSTATEYATGYLVSLNAATLAPVAHVALYDPRGGLATLLSDSSASPMVGPDGDVYYGVLESPCCSSHNDRGGLLHYNAGLTQTTTPGSFGWDDTPSVVPAVAVPSYAGVSSYLILMKYNNYAGIGSGDGVNKVAVLDPSAAMQDEYSSTSVTVMKEAITVTGVTPDPDFGLPNAVREWCINTAAVDPYTKSAIINSEDGVVYRWAFTSNSLLQRLRLTSGRSEAYTPTVIGPDGTVYAINDAILFAIGN